LLPRLGKPHPTHPAERRRAQKQFEMRLERSRANPCNIGKLFEPNRFGQVAAEPAKGAHHIGREGARGLYAALSGTPLIVLANRVTARHRRRTPTAAANMRLH
jgi:hypothetical protein